MPRYFFDVYHLLDVPDEEGLEFADLETARREAIQAAGAMLAEQSEEWIGAAWKMEIRDEAGAIVARLSFTAT